MCRLLNCVMSAYLYDVCSTVLRLPTFCDVCSTEWRLPTFAHVAFLYDPPTCMITAQLYGVFWSFRWQLNCAAEKNVGINSWKNCKINSFFTSSSLPSPTSGAPFVLRFTKWSFARFLFREKMIRNEILLCNHFHEQIKNKILCVFCFAKTCDFLQNTVRFASLSYIVKNDF